MDKVGGTLLTNVTLVTMNRNRDIILDGALAWMGDRIVGVGKTHDLLAQFPDYERIDGAQGLLTPGWIDAHNHSAHFLSKGLLDDVATDTRWKTLLYPFESALLPEECYWGAIGTFAEQLLHGTTCIGEAGSAYPHEVARAAETIGIRASLMPQATDHFDQSRPFSADVDRSTAGVAAQSDQLFEELHGRGNGLISVAFGLWSGSTVSDELCVRVRDLAQKRGAIIHGHLSTRDADNDVSLQQHGVRQVERYRRLGVLGANFVGAHAGAINDEEVEILARSESNITHCPSASMLGGFGCVAHGKFPELVEAKVSVALGSDAASISRFLDMPRLMYLAACAHKDVRQDASIMGAHVAMEMATIGGARALGLDGITGSLEVGKRADITLVRTDSIEWQPRPAFNPVANLVYSSSGARVDTVAVAGKILVRHGKLQSLPTDEILDGTSRAASAVIARAGIPMQTRWPTH